MHGRQASTWLCIFRMLSPIVCPKVLSDRFAWRAQSRALGSRTSGCAQILDKEALAYLLSATDPSQSSGRPPVNRPAYLHL